MAGLICLGLTSLNLGKPEKCSNGLDDKVVPCIKDLKLKA
jgi:hypothetical protein